MSIQLVSLLYGYQIKTSRMLHPPSSKTYVQEEPRKSGIGRQGAVGPESYRNDSVPGPAKGPALRVRYRRAVRFESTDRFAPPENPQRRRFAARHPERALCILRSRTRRYRCARRHKCFIQDPRGTLTGLVCAYPADLCLLRIWTYMGASGLASGYPSDAQRGSGCTLIFGLKLQTDCLRALMEFAKNVLISRHAL